jgi:hypothetical protein
MDKVQKPKDSDSSEPWRFYTYSKFLFHWKRWKNLLGWIWAYMSWRHKIFNEVIVITVLPVTKITVSCGRWWLLWLPNFHSATGENPVFTISCVNHVIAVFYEVSPHLWADCLDNVGSLTPHNPIGLQGLLRDSFTLLTECIPLLRSPTS